MRQKQTKFTVSSLNTGKLLYKDRTRDQQYTGGLYIQVQKHGKHTPEDL